MSDRNLLNPDDTSPDKTGDISPEAAIPSQADGGLPADGAPTEGTPKDGTPTEEGSTDELPISNDDPHENTLAAWWNEPGAGGISCGGWAGIGLGAGLLLSVAAVLISRAVRQGKRGLSGGRIWVDELHEQGARSGQQDCFYVSCGGEWISDAAIRGGAPGVLAVVADGMGGLSNGDQVSQAAVSAIAQSFYQVQGAPQQVLLQLAERANAAVNRLLGEDGLYHSGSTLVAGMLRDGAFHYLSIGDSRICLYRNGVLYQLNREHIYRNELSVRFVNGEENLETVAGHPKASGLTSFLGMGQLKYIDLPAEPVQVRRGDQFILMSDGVYNALTPEEIMAALKRGPGRAAKALDEAIRAKNYQNQDNYTAVILNC